MSQLKYILGLFAAYAVVAQRIRPRVPAEPCSQGRWGSGPVV